MGEKEGALVAALVSLVSLVAAIVSLVAAPVSLVWPLVSPLEASSTASLPFEIKQHLVSHLISFHKHCNLRAAVFVYVGVWCTCSVCWRLVSLFGIHMVLGLRFRGGYCVGQLAGHT